MPTKLSMREIFPRTRYKVLTHQQTPLQSRRFNFFLKAAKRIDCANNYYHLKMLITLIAEEVIKFLQEEIEGEE